MIISINVNLYLIQLIYSNYSTIYCNTRQKFNLTILKEPNIFIDVGKVNFGPLLLGGKQKEIVKLRNLEDIPIPFNF
jgi:hypothetical protein